MELNIYCQRLNMNNEAKKYNMEDWTKTLGLNTTELFSNPFEAFNKIAGDSQEIMKNNMKYHKACINYHQAIHDMLEAVSDNAKILKGDKK